MLCIIVSYCGIFWNSYKSVNFQRTPLQVSIVASCCLLRVGLFPEYVAYASSQSSWQSVHQCRLLVLLPWKSR